MPRTLLSAVTMAALAVLAIVLALVGAVGSAQANEVDGIHWQFNLDTADPQADQPFTVYLFPYDYSGSPYMFTSLVVTQEDPPTVQVKSQQGNDTWILTPSQTGKILAHTTGNIETTKCWPSETPPCQHSYFVVSPDFSINIGAPQDADRDGCPDANEDQFAQGSELSGGGRDRLNPYDYFNPTHDGQNRVDDILLVVAQYFKDDSDGNPGLPPYDLGYNPDTDRTLVGPNAWNLGPPNGQQRVDDILSMVLQYFHDCS